MVSLTCLTVDTGCFSGPNGCPSGMLNWASAQHEASQGCKIAKAEAASSLKVYVLKFTQHHFCHVQSKSQGQLSFKWWKIRLILLMGGAAKSHLKGTWTLGFIEDHYDDLPQAVSYTHLYAP